MFTSARNDIRITCMNLKGTCTCWGELGKKKNQRKQSSQPRKVASLLLSSSSAITCSRCLQINPPLQRLKSYGFILRGIFCCLGSTTALHYRRQRAAASSFCRVHVFLPPLVQCDCSGLLCCRLFPLICLPLDGE